MLSEAQRRIVHRHISSSLLAELEREARRGYDPRRSRVYCELCARELQGAGVDEVTIESLPWGPRHRYGAWRGAPSTEIRRAELWLLDDDGEEELLADSTALMGAHRPTAAEGEVFEVVDAGDGANAATYGRQRLAGKVALVSGFHPRLAQHEALHLRGADGLLCGPGGAGGVDELSPRQLLDPAFFADHRPFGFNLTARQYERLLRLLGSGKSPRVRVQIDLRLADEERPVVRARLEGSASGPPVLIVADLGATAAVGVAIVATIQSALEAHHELRLGRDLELLLLPGDSGALWWLKEQTRGHSLIELRGEGDGWRLLEPPSLRASTLSDLLRDHFETQQQDVPSASSASPLLACHGAPAAGLSLGAELSRRSVARLTGALASAALELTLLDESHLSSLLAAGELYAAERAVQRARILRRQLRRALDETSSRGQQARHQLWHADQVLTRALEDESRRLASCARLVGGTSAIALEHAEVMGRLTRLKTRLFEALLVEARGLGEKARLTIKRRPLTALERRAEKVIVHRSYEGPFPQPLLPTLAHEDDRQWLLQHEPEIERLPHGDALLLWADGERNLLEISELAGMDCPDVDLKLLWRYLDVLAGAKLVSLEIHTNVASALDAR